MYVYYKANNGVINFEFGLSPYKTMRATSKYSVNYSEINFIKLATVGSPSITEQSKCSVVKVNRFPLKTERFAPSITKHFDNRIVCSLDNQTFR